MAEGRTNHAIATTFTVSERAVEKHVANIFAKLDLPPRTRETGGCWRCFDTWRTAAEAHARLLLTVVFALVANLAYQQWPA